MDRRCVYLAAVAAGTGFSLSGVFPPLYIPLKFAFRWPGAHVSIPRHRVLNPFRVVRSWDVIRPPLTPEISFAWSGTKKATKDRPAEVSAAGITCAGKREPEPLAGYVSHTDDHTVNCGHETTIGADHVRI